MSCFQKFLVKVCYLLVLILTCASSQVVNAQSVLDPNDPIREYNASAPPAQPTWGQIGKWVRTKRLNWNTDAYKAYIYKGTGFRLKFPKTYNPTAVDDKRYPMIIMFHGKGEGGPATDNEFQLYHGGQVHLNAVNNGVFDGYVFYMQSGGSWGTTSYDLVKEIIDYMVINNKLDPFRISAHGLSAGGEGTWGMANKYPTYIAAALPMSWTSIVYKDDAGLKSRLKWISMWNFQGGLDPAPTPSTSTQVRDAMLAVGANYKYTEYPNLGHGTWNTAYAEKDFFPYLNRAHKANPWTLFGRTEFCPGDPINVVIGVSPGFDQYEWRKDGELITGSTSNQITVTSVGTYDCRIRKGTIWSPWSPIPVQIKIKEATISPDVTVSGVASKVIPSLDGKTSVALEVPAGYTSYLWQKTGSTTTLSTTRNVIAESAGSYRVKVTEQFGCSSDFSSPFSVIDANGPNKPDPAINLVVTTLSKTELRLDWSDNPSPQHNETNFEIYQANQQGGPYKLVGFTEADVVTYTVESLNPNTKYFFKVRAINNTGASAGSNEATGVTDADTQAPMAPANLRVIGTTRNAITLEWDESIDDVGVTKYDLYINGVRSFVVSGTSFTANNLQSNSTYTFTVKARDFAGNTSPASNQVTAQALLKGLNYAYYEGDWDALPDFKTLVPVKTGTTSNVSLAPTRQEDYFGFLWEGFIKVPVNGSYTFRTNSDDGSKLYLGALNQTTSAYNHTATPLVNNDGLHGSQNRDGTITLQAGTYPIAITFFEKNGGHSIIVSWRTPLTGTSFVTIPDNVFSDPVVAEGQPPIAPSSLTAKSLSYNKINLTWQDNSDNESGFEVYRSNSLAGIYTTIGLAPANTASFIDSTLEPARRYYYKVRAIGQYGESALVSNYTEAQWQFNNSFNDASGNNRDLIQTSFPTIDGNEKREGTHSVRLNGSTQYLTINTADGYLKNAYSEKTIAFWMKSNNNTGGLVIVDIGGSDDGLALRLDNNQLFAGVASNNVRRSFSVPYSSTTWNHIALVYKENALRLYINGALAGAITDISFSSTGSTTNGSRIGSVEGNNAFNTGSGRFNGWLDNFGIFGFALNEQDIVAHMNNALGESNATTLPLPAALTAPENLVASVKSPNALQVNWAYNPPSSTTTTIPATTVRVEAESFVNQNGISTQASSEGGLNVTNIGQNDFMDYNIDLATSGNHTFSFRVGNNTTNVQFDLRKLDGTILATFDVPRTGSTQVYTTLTKSINLPKGQHTLRVFASRNSNWTFNWFEIASQGETIVEPVTNKASGLELYRSSSNTNNYLLLTTLPSQATSYVDSGLFANAVYYYKIKAVNSASVSAYSNEDSAKTGNNVPVITAIEDQYVRFGTQQQLEVKAVDADPDALTVTVTNLPSFATYKNTENGAGIITFSPEITDVGIYENIQITAGDPNGGTHSISFKLNVNENFNPVISTVNNVTLNEKQTAELSFSATDENVNDALVFSFSGMPAFATPVIEGNQVKISLAPGYADNGSYHVTAKVSDGVNGVDSTSFTITVNDVNPNKKVYINFTDGTFRGAAPWNNTNKIPALNDNFSNLLDETGANSSIGFQVTSPWQNIGNGTNTYGVNTGNNSGVYPDAVMRSAWFTDGNIQTIRFYGLDQSYKYTFTFFGSRADVTDNRTTLYTIGGSSATLNAASNRQNTISIPSIQPNTDGTLTLTLQRATGSQYGYLNAMVIESVFDDGTVPARPRNLSVELVNNVPKLTWIDAAYNEKAYQVFRADNPTGPFELLNPVGNNAGLQQYSDATVLGNTTYYYTVKAANDYGISVDNETVSINIPNAAPRINSIPDVNAKTEQSLQVAVTATDDLGDIIKLSASGLPSFVSFTDLGGGKGVFQITPGNTTGVFENVILTATDDKGAYSSRQFKITVTLKGTSTILVNFNQVQPAAAPWNSFTNTPIAGRSLTGLKNDEGTITGAAITLVDGWEGANDVGATTGNNSGVFPDDVMKTAYFESSTNSKRIRITGLTSVNTKYNLVFFASRGGISDVRNTVFSAGGKSVTLNAAGNTSKTVQINGLAPDANGVIEFTVSKASGTSYAYINALAIQAYFDNGLPLAPANLQAIVKSKTAIQLNWTNRNDAQTNVEVYRSSTPNGTYSLIATLGGNVSTYTNASLLANTKYYYKVRVLHNGTYSEYSNTIGAATLAYQVHVNFNQVDPAGEPWNNTNNVPQDGSIYANLKNELSNPSGVNLTVVGSNFNGVNPYGMNTGNNSGIYPDNVIKSTWWLDAGAVATLKIDGLNQSVAYNFVFFASRDGSGSAPDRSTVYSIGNASVSLNAVNNISKTVQINNVKPDAEGAVYINIQAASTSPFAYIGALVIEGYSAPDPVIGEVVMPANIQPVVTRTKSTGVETSVVNKSLEKKISAVSIEKDDMRIYPNPFASALTVELQLVNSADKLLVTIIDVSGKAVLTKTWNNVPAGKTTYKLELNGSSIQSGVYFVRITDIKTGKVQMMKVIKQ